MSIVTVALGPPYCAWELLIPFAVIGIIWTAVFVGSFLWHVFLAPHRWAVERETKESNLREQLAVKTREARIQQLRADLLLSMRDATQEIPRHVNLIQPDVTASKYSGARNRANMALQQWIAQTAPILREGGHPGLAAAFESRDDDDLTTREGIQVAYDRRVALLSPLPNLEVQE